MHKAGSRHELRKRSQVLTVLEHALVFYRNLLATVSTNIMTGKPAAGFPQSGAQQAGRLHHHLPCEHGTWRQAKQDGCGCC